MKMLANYKPNLTLPNITLPNITFREICHLYNSRNLPFTEIQFRLKEASNRP